MLGIMLAILLSVLGRHRWTHKRGPVNTIDREVCWQVGKGLDSEKKKKKKIALALINS